MNILIAAKSLKQEPKEVVKSATAIGDYFSEERFYTLVNCQIDDGLRKYSTLLYIITVFMFRSYNFKHLTETITKKPKWVTAIDVFCWLCLLAFIVCLVTGVASPLVSALQSAIKGNFEDFVNSFNEALSEPKTIALFLTAIFTFAIAMMYMYVMKKIVAVNKKMSLKEYVTNKLSFVNRFQNMIKVNKKVNKEVLKAAKKAKINPKIQPDKFYLITNVESLGNGDRWSILQISNLMYNLFPESGLIFMIKQIETADLEKLKIICQTDFQYTSIFQLD